MYYTVQVLVTRIMVSQNDANQAKHATAPSGISGHAKLLYSGFISGLIQAGILHVRRDEVSCFLRGLSESKFL